MNDPYAAFADLDASPFAAYAGAASQDAAAFEAFANGVVAKDYDPSAPAAAPAAAAPVDPAEELIAGLLDAPALAELGSDIDRLLGIVPFCAATLRRELLAAAEAGGKDGLRAACLAWAARVDSSLLRSADGAAWSFPHGFTFACVVVLLRDLLVNDVIYGEALHVLRSHRNIPCEAFEAWMRDRNLPAVAEYFSEPETVISCCDLACQLVRLDRFPGCFTYDCFSDAQEICHTAARDPLGVFEHLGSVFDAPAPAAAAAAAPSRGRRSAASVAGDALVAVSLAEGKKKGRARSAEAEELDDPDFEEPRAKKGKASCDDDDDEEEDDGIDVAADEEEPRAARKRSGKKKKNATPRRRRSSPPPAEAAVPAAAAAASLQAMAQELRRVGSGAPVSSTDVWSRHPFGWSDESLTSEACRCTVRAYDASVGAWGYCLGTGGCKTIDKDRGGLLSERCKRARFAIARLGKTQAALRKTPVDRIFSGADLELFIYDGPEKAGKDYWYPRDFQVFTRTCRVADEAYGVFVPRCEEHKAKQAAGSAKGEAFAADWFRRGALDYCLSCQCSILSPTWQQGLPAPESHAARAHAEPGVVYRHPESATLACAVCLTCQREFAVVHWQLTERGLAPTHVSDELGLHAIDSDAVAPDRQPVFHGKPEVRVQAGASASAAPPPAAAACPSDPLAAAEPAALAAAEELEISAAAAAASAASPSQIVGAELDSERSEIVAVYEGGQKRAVDPANLVQLQRFGLLLEGISNALRGVLPAEGGAASDNIVSMIHEAERGRYVVGTADGKRIPLNAAVKSPAVAFVRGCQDILERGA